MSLSEDVVADVLSYLRGTPDWIALYKAYEAMNKDVNALKPERDPSPDGRRKQELAHFDGRRSYTDIQRLGVTQMESLAQALSFSDASTLVRSMIKVWLEWRS